jgi:sterol desaturase/sphingolipid hydroxylase (fatty acid hydroxylase superfamily)
MFHHSNLRLPGGWDRRLAAILTTPRMHGIHHSRRRSEMDSNWSSGIALWDHLHSTFRDTPPQSAIIIGVDDAAAERDLALDAALEAPFRAQPARRSGGGGTHSHQ